MSSKSAWAESPLDTVAKAFELLVCEPAPLAFDGRGFAGLPDVMLPLEELQELLLAPATSRAVRDAVWRELVVRARRDGPAWVIATVGLALPGLRKMARLLAAGWHGDQADLDAELLAGFVERLRDVDIDASRLCGKLIDAGVRGARKVRDQYSDTHLVRAESAGPRLPIVPWDHPDWVLARAVAAAVVHPDDAKLIAATRLERHTLAHASAVLGISPAVAEKRRSRAELALRDAILAGELDFMTAGSARRKPSMRKGKFRRPVGSLLGSAGQRNVVLGTQQQPLGGKKPVRLAPGFGAPGIGVAPAA